MIVTFSEDEIDYIDSIYTENIIDRPLLEYLITTQKCFLKLEFNQPPTNEFTITLNISFSNQDRTNKIVFGAAILPNEADLMPIYSINKSNSPINGHQFKFTPSELKQSSSGKVYIFAFPRETTNHLPFDIDINT